MDAAIALDAILLIIQMWVLTASLEGYLAGHTGVALPAALVSGALLLGCWLLYLFVIRIDRESRQDSFAAESGSPAGSLVAAASDDPPRS
jgi:Family of unknown function (DUF6755)